MPHARLTLRLSLLSLGALVCHVPDAAAQGSTSDEALKLTWVAPPGCPSSDDVRTATLRSADTKGAKDIGPALEAEARVEQNRSASAPASSAWKVRLRTRRGATTGEREIEASTCNGVADATALVLALALVPPGFAPSAPSFDEPTAPPAPPTPPARDEPKTSRDASRSSRPDGSHLFALGVSVISDTATLPSAGLGGAATLAVTPGRLRLEVGAHRFAEQSRDVTSAAAIAGVSTAGAAFSLTSVGGRGCYTLLQNSTFDLAPCGGADVHLISANGYGADSNFEASAEWVALAAGALGRVKITHWFSVRARVDGFAPLTRPTFVVTNEGSVHRPPTFGAAASFGVELLFL